MSRRLSEVEKKKEKSTKSESHCEELAKILAMCFTLYQSEKLHLWKSLGWGRPFWMNRTFLIRKITTVFYISRCISLFPSLLLQVRLPDSVFSRNQCIPIKSFIKLFFLKERKKNQPVLQIEETFSSEMDTRVKCKSWDTSETSHLLKIH